MKIPEDVLQNWDSIPRSFSTKNKLYDHNESNLSVNSTSQNKPSNKNPKILDTSLHNDDFISKNIRIHVSDSNIMIYRRSWVDVRSHRSDYISSASPKYKDWSTCGLELHYALFFTCTFLNFK